MEGQSSSEQKGGDYDEVLEILMGEPADLAVNGVRSAKPARKSAVPSPHGRGVNATAGGPRARFGKNASDASAVIGPVTDKEMEYDARWFPPIESTGELQGYITEVEIYLRTEGAGVAPVPRTVTERQKVKQAIAEYADEVDSKEKTAKWTDRFFRMQQELLG